MRTLRAARSDIASVTIAPDSTLALVAEAKGATIVDIRNDRLIKAFTESSEIKEGRFLADAKRLVVRDGTEFTVYDIPGGAVSLTFTQSDVQCWTLKPDGKVSILGRVDNGFGRAVQLSEVDLQMGRPRLIARNDAMTADGCEMSTDGERIVSIEAQGGIGIRSPISLSLQVRLIHGTGEQAGPPHSHPEVSSIHIQQQWPDSPASFAW